MTSLTQHLPNSVQSRLKALTSFALLFVSLSCFVRAGDGAYFVTYSQHMEEPGSLEVAPSFTLGMPRTSHKFLANLTEIEYGVNGWWTTELYLDSQKTFKDTAVFTGFRSEHRFRPLVNEHRVTPVIYFEYSRVNGAEKTLKEVVGFDSRADFDERNADSKAETKHELETKLILGSNYKGWNISENFIAEKVLNEDEPWEFGYAFGVSRPLRLSATSRECRWCRENFVAGVEFYGGLGTADDFTARGTSHYAAPVLAWRVSDAFSVRVSPTFGLNGKSIPYMTRFGVSYEIPRFDRQIRNLLR